jgi:hypothetical protein
MGRPEKVLIICWGKAEGNNARKKPVLLPLWPFIETILFLPAWKGVGLNLLRGGEGLGHQSF